MAENADLIQYIFLIFRSFIHLDPKCPTCALFKMDFLQKTKK